MVNSQSLYSIPLVQSGILIQVILQAIAPRSQNQQSAIIFPAATRAACRRSEPFRSSHTLQSPRHHSPPFSPNLISQSQRLHIQLHRSTQRTLSLLPDRPSRSSSLSVSNWPTKHQLLSLLPSPALADLHLWTESTYQIKLRQRLQIQRSAEYYLRRFVALRTVVY